MYVLIKMFTKEKIISLELQVEENVSYWNKLVFFLQKKIYSFVQNYARSDCLHFQKSKIFKYFQIFSKKSITQMGCK